MPPCWPSQKVLSATASVAVSRFASFERPPRGLRELGALRGPVVVLRLELHVFARLRKGGAERVRHDATRGSDLNIAWHWVSISLRVGDKFSLMDSQKGKTPSGRENDAGFGTKFRDDAGSNPNAATTSIWPRFWDRLLRR